MIFLVGCGIGMTSQRERLLECYLATLPKTNQLQGLKNLKMTKSVAIPAVCTFSSLLPLKAVGSSASDVDEEGSQCGVVLYLYEPEDGSYKSETGKS